MIVRPGLIDGSEIAVDVNHHAGRARVVLRRAPKVERTVLSLDAQVLSTGLRGCVLGILLRRSLNWGKQAGRQRQCEHQSREKKDEDTPRHGVAREARRVTSRW